MRPSPEARFAFSATAALALGVGAASLEHLIATYGYLAVAVGTFLEGETVLAIAGLAAHRGYLDFWYVVLTAFLGSLAGDQFYFFLGRKHGAVLLARRPAWQARAARIHRIVERHPALFIFASRFALLYGFRTVAPFVIGMSRTPTLRFVFFNTIGAAVWALSVGAIGYFFGHAVELLLGDIKRYEREAFLFLIAVGASLWLWRFLRRRRPA